MSAPLIAVLGGIGFSMLSLSTSRALLARLWAVLAWVCLVTGAVLAGLP